MSFAGVRRLTRTVGFRLAAWHAATFLIGAALVFSAAYFLLQRSIDEQTRDAIEFRFRQFASEYERGGEEAVIALCKLRSGRAQKAFFVRLANARNETIFLRDPDDWAEFQPRQLEHREVPKGFSWSEIDGMEDQELRLATVRMRDGSVLQVGKSLEAGEALLATFRTAIVAVAGIVILTAVVGGASMALRALRPVHELTATVHSILDTGKFTARVPSRATGDEIDELVQCFNGMLGRIDLLIRGMRDSLDNVTHDLRTPLTRLRIISMRAIEQDADKATCQTALGDCLEESERVLTMLSTLMDITEAQTGVMKLDRKRIDVPTLVGQVVDLYEHVAEEKEIAIAVEIPRGLSPDGDPARLVRALGNLLDNALKYTTAGGRVSLRAGREGATVRIDVADTGVGIPRDELDRIWERLYRVDKSRSQRGLGLGLSFVKAIVEAHGGRVGVNSELGKGSLFALCLPD
jgi:signal transduction histidine kinase